ncbi:hypothetical protein HDU98_005452 [Podochytrium sp. JEL0797]|nr:hypothetical protein HDU98_005452 [Podochytrium sp. JEL0797]
MAYQVSTRRTTSSQGATSLKAAGLRFAGGPRCRTSRLVVFVMLTGTVILLSLWNRASMAHVDVEKQVAEISAARAAKLLQTNSATPSSTPRILYYNRHSACHANMVQVTSRLNLTFETFNPGFLGGLGMKGERANDIINDGLVKVLCAVADVIIVADTMPDARPLFQSLARENKAERCKANIVLELTTRFDWGIPDGQEYYKLNWKLAHMNPKNLFWVTNNAFEPLDLSYEALATPKFRMLRPTGHSQLDAQEIPESDKLLALCREEEHSAIFAIMRRMNIPFKHVNGGYGGPKTLAKYKAFIEFPYQVSTMKLYENLAAGVVMLVPSKDFFRELIEKDLHSFGPWDKISRAGPDTWHLHMDYYHPDLSPYIYYFTSFDHLHALLTSSTILDSRNVRVEAPKAYARLVEKGLHGWADMFAEMGWVVGVDGKKHVVGSGEGTVVKAGLYKEGVVPPKGEEEWEREWMRLDEWKGERRNERMSAARGVRAGITEMEMDAYTTSLERKNPQAKRFAQLDGKFEGMDLGLVGLLDVVNGEVAGVREGVFGGSLAGMGEGEVEGGVVGKGMRLVYELVMSVPHNAVIGPSNYVAVSKLQRAFRIVHSVLFLDSASKAVKSGVRGEVRERLLAPLNELERKNLDKKMKVLSKVVYPWAFSNRFSGMMDLLESFNQPRGIVLSFGNGGFEQGLLTIMHIRKNLDCHLPMQIFYNGLMDLDADKIEALNRIDGVTTKNLQEVFTGIAEDRNYHSKPYAILASTFQQVIYIDDDVVLFQNPETLLKQSALFKQYGTLFFKGRSYDFGNSKWVRWFIKSPSLTANTTGRYFRDVSKDEMDASLMLFDKSRLEVVHGLLSTCHLNLREVREGGLDKHLQGDKETYWLALELLRIPYQFVPGIAGAAGTLQQKDGKSVPNSVCGPQSHLDEHGQLLHVNSRSARYNNELDKFEKTLSHYIAPVSDKPGNIDSTQQPWCVSGEVGSQEVVAVGAESKRLVLKLRELDMEVRHDSWKHYVENHM